MTSRVFFKTAELAMQFVRNLDPRLRAVNYDIAEFCERKYHKQWVITDILRDDKTSAHHYGRANDARSFHFTEDEIREIIEYLDSVWGADTSPEGQRTEAGRKKFLRLLYHKGTAWHFHLAINSSHSRGDYFRDNKHI